MGAGAIVEVAGSGGNRGKGGLIDIPAKRSCAGMAARGELVGRVAGGCAAKHVHVMGAVV